MWPACPGSRPAGCRGQRPPGSSEAEMSTCDLSLCEWSHHGPPQGREVLDLRLPCTKRRTNPGEGATRPLTHPAPAGRSGQRIGTESGAEPAAWLSWLLPRAAALHTNMKLHYLSKATRPMARALLITMVVSTVLVANASARLPRLSLLLGQAGSPHPYHHPIPHFKSPCPWEPLGLQPPAAGHVQGLWFPGTNPAAWIGQRLPSRC